MHNCKNYLDLEIIALDKLYAAGPTLPDLVLFHRIF